MGLATQLRAERRFLSGSIHALFSIHSRVDKSSVYCHKMLSEHVQHLVSASLAPLGAGCWPAR